MKYLLKSKFELDLITKKEFPFLKNSLICQQITNKIRLPIKFELFNALPTSLHLHRNRQ